MCESIVLHVNFRAPTKKKYCQVTVELLAGRGKSTNKVERDRDPNIQRVCGTSQSEISGAKQSVKAKARPPCSASFMHIAHSAIYVYTFKSAGEKVKFALESVSRRSDISSVRCNLVYETSRVDKECSASCDSNIFIFLWPTNIMLKALKWKQ